MVRAVEGLMEEKAAMFNSFILSVSSFLVMGVAICWIIMPIYAGSVFTGISILASYCWYRYSERIFLRFRLHEETTAYSNRKSDNMSPNEDDIKTTAEPSDMYGRCKYYFSFCSEIINVFSFFQWTRTGNTVYHISKRQNRKGLKISIRNFQKKSRKRVCCQ